MDEKDKKIETLQMEIDTLKSAAQEQERLVVEGYTKLDNMLREVEEKRNELEKANTSLSSTKEFVDRLFNTMSDGLIVMGVDGNIRQINKSLLDRLGFEEKDLLGANPDKIFEAQEIRQCRSRIAQSHSAQKSIIYELFSQREDEDQELKLVDREGNRIEHLFRGSVLYNYQGKKEGMVLIATDIRDLKQTQKNLEDAVEQITSLKNQQDGDYFLISLILEPLQLNQNKSSSVSTDFYVEQKKKFSYHNRHLQIGGDICISSNLELAGRSYTLFCNSDAMGKSMQGAGGALLFGTIINSLIKRPFDEQATKESKVAPPVKWLYDAFKELNSFFMTFDGSMMISAVMGLIDDDSGVLYYFNACHPWSVLYRKGRVSFVEKGLNMRKIGVPLTDIKSFRVKKIQLHPGDVIVSGSDGRDDLLLDQGEGAEPVLNEDEKLFLNMVRETGGQLNPLVERIFSTGHLTDDLSLARVAYHG